MNSEKRRDDFLKELQAPAEPSVKFGFGLSYKEIEEELDRVIEGMFGSSSSDDDDNDNDDSYDEDDDYI